MSGTTEIALNGWNATESDATFGRGSLKIRARLPIECLQALTSLEAGEPGSTSGPFGLMLERCEDQELHVVVQMHSCQCGAKPANMRIESTAESCEGSGEQLASDEVAARLATLTQRETEVMQLIVDGLSQKQIAARLGISIQTAAKHRAKVLQKMHVANDVELVRLTLSAARRPA